MARLHCHGKELLRIEKVLEGDALSEFAHESNIIWARKTKAYMEDGTILIKEDWKHRKDASTYPSSDIQGRWTVKGKLKKGWSIEWVRDEYMKKGWSVSLGANAAKRHFSTQENQDYKARHFSIAPSVLGGSHDPIGGRS